MGFHAQDEYEEFMGLTPDFEATIVRSGIRWIKYFFDVSQEEQERRFRQRITVRADNKKRARLNCIEHLIRQIPHKKVKFTSPDLPKRKKQAKGVPDQPTFPHFVEERH